MTRVPCAFEWFDPADGRSGCLCTGWRKGTPWENIWPALEWTAKSNSRGYSDSNVKVIIAKAKAIWAAS